MKSSQVTKAPQRSALIRPFYPALDGLRALAFLAVFLVHYGPLGWNNALTHWGWVGVDLFFVLSGFLITGILYDSFHHPHYFRNFYVRRVLRIFPIFYGFWLIVLLLTPWLHIEWGRFSLGLVAYLGNFFFLSSWRAWQSYPFRAGTLAMYLPWNHHLFLLPVAHLWTLCIEEQFYLVWPAVMWFVRSRRVLLRLCIAVIIIAPVGRTLYLYLHPEAVRTPLLYINTFSRIDTLLVGAALALWLRGRNPDPDRLRIWTAAVGCGAPILLAVLWTLEKSHPPSTEQDTMVSTIGYSLIAFSSAAMVLGSIGVSKTLTRWLQWKPLTWLGRISYGLYFFHMFPFTLVPFRVPWLRAHHLSALILIAPLAYDVAIAWLSFRYFESPFLRLKSKLAPDRTHVADPIPVQPALDRSYSAVARS